MPRFQTRVKNFLAIRGKFPSPSPFRARPAHRRERPYAPFQRRRQAFPAQKSAESIDSLSPLCL